MRYPFPVSAVFLLLILLSGNAFSQNMEFDTSGLLLNEQYTITKTGCKKCLWVIPCKCNQAKTFTTPVVKDQATIEAALKKGDRQILIDKLETTIDLLDPANSDKKGLRLFLEHLWTTVTVAEYRKELKDLKDYLEQDNVAGVITLTKLNKVIQPVKDHLFSTSSPIYELKPQYLKDGFHTFELWRSYPMNKFAIDFYNATITPAIKDISLSELVRYGLFSNRQLRTADSLINVLLASSDKIDLTLLNEIDKFHRSLITTAEYRALESILKENWFMNWFWYRGGQLVLNPLDFTTDEFLKTNPQYDIAKAKAFDDYIEAVIKKYMDYDTTGNVDQFRKILALKGTGKDEYSFAGKIKAATDANKASATKLQQTKKMLNKVMVPEKLEYYSYTATGDFKSGTNKDKYLSRLVTEDGVKNLVVHNIPADRKAAFAIQKTVSPDVSEVQKLTDTIGGMAAQLAALSIKFSPYSGIFDFFTNSVADNGLIAKARANPPAAAASHNPLMREYLRELVVTYYWDEAIFNSLIVDIDEGDPYTESEADQTIAKEFLAKYARKAADKLYPVIKTDSLYLAHMRDFATHSTIPLAKLKASEDKQPLYSSVLLTTPGSKEAVKEEVTVYTTKSDKDTVKLKSFSYERGKHNRFQISAGIAYTFADVTQSEASVEGGSIKIRNSFQRYRLSAGVHVHLGKGLVLKDNRFAGNFLERSSVYVGVGIPKPLENVYLGYSYDFFPGLKTILGMHFYKHNDYEIQNNQIISEDLRYKVAFPFLAIQIDPAGLLKALNVIKPN